MPRKKQKQTKAKKNRIHYHIIFSLSTITTYLLCFYCYVVCRVLFHNRFYFRGKKKCRSQIILRLLSFSFFFPSITRLFCFFPYFTRLFLSFCPLFNLPLFFRFCQSITFFLHNPLVKYLFQFSSFLTSKWFLLLTSFKKSFLSSFLVSESLIYI